MRTRQSICSFSLLLLGVALEAAAQSAPVDIGSVLGSNVETSAQVINENGETAGVYRAIGVRDFGGFFWSPSAGIVLIPSLPGYRSIVPEDLNDYGQVVGTVYNDSALVARAVSWTAAGGMVDLGTLGGPSSWANFVNNAGQVVGVSQTADGQWHLFNWTVASGMLDLGTLGGSYVVPEALNERGDVVGWGETASGRQHGFLWTPIEGMRDLDTITGVPSAFSQALDINDFGQVVGSMQPLSTPDQPLPGTYAFSWAATAGLVLLGRGEYSSVANAVSNTGQVVGDGALTSGPDGFDYPVAFSWTPTGNAVRLEGQQTATDVNDRGQVVGWGNEGDLVVPFLWTAAEGLVNLDSLNGANAFALQLNNRGDVIGTVSPPPLGRAVIWHVPPAQVILDTDGDAVPDSSDTCPTVSNPTQQDLDQDRVGDVCDPSLNVAPVIDRLLSLIPIGVQHHGQRNALTSKLRAALDSWNSGDANATLDSLQAFFDHLGAQRGKKVATEAADEMKRIAEILMTAINDGTAA